MENQDDTGRIKSNRCWASNNNRVRKHPADTLQISPPVLRSDIVNQKQNFLLSLKLALESISAHYK